MVVSMSADWESLSHAQLLEVRLCDLDLPLEDTWVDELTAKVQRELERRELRLRPHFWVADEWFSPENIPGVGLPFYLMHPRLTRLERRMMFEVEGGTKSECLKLLRHEIGHAVQHAYALHRRRRWQTLFGSATVKYPDAYRPRPNSKRFVQHLDGWYAQSHPVEDFAETFAVWLTPRRRWRREYAGWKGALAKLEYVDALMTEIAGKAPKVRSRARPYALRTLKHTLGEHYRRRTEHYSTGYSDQYDRDLLKVFSDDAGDAECESAAAFLRRNRRNIRERVASFTGEYQFTLEQVLKEMAGRCKELGLRVTSSEEDAMMDFALMLTVHTVHTLHMGGEWHPM